MEDRVADGGQRAHEGGLDARDGRGVEVIALGVLLFERQRDAHGETDDVRGDVEVLGHVTTVGVDALFLVVLVDLLERGNHSVGITAVHLRRVVVHTVQVNAAAERGEQVFVAQQAPCLTLELIVVLLSSSRECGLVLASEEQKHHGGGGEQRHGDGGMPR